MNQFGPSRRLIATLGVLFFLPAALRAGAIARASLSVSIQYPDAIVNQFGFSGPLTSFPDPEINEIPDGVVNKATPASISTAQLSPLVFLVTDGPADVQTTNDGDASATIEGSLSGNLANLSAVPLTVTFSFNIEGSLYTQVDMEGPDYADAKIEALFNFGGVTNDYEAESLDGALISLTGLSDGDLSVTIPASSTVPYQLDLSLLADASSECSLSACDVAPEPGTTWLLFPSLAAFLLRNTRKKGPRRCPMRRHRCGKFHCLVARDSALCASESRLKKEKLGSGSV